ERFVVHHVQGLAVTMLPVCEQARVAQEKVRRFLQRILVVEPGMIQREQLPVVRHYRVERIAPDTEDFRTRQCAPDEADLPEVQWQLVDAVQAGRGTGTQGVEVVGSDAGRRSLQCSGDRFNVQQLWRARA